MALLTIRPLPRSHLLREAFLASVGGTLPSPGPFGHHCLWSPAREGGRRVHAGVWAHSRPRSLVRSLLTMRVQVQGQAPPPGCPPSFSLHPHSDPTSNWLQRPLHAFPSVPSSQGTGSQAHGQFIYRVLISFPGWPRKELWPFRQTDRGQIPVTLGSCKSLPLSRPSFPCLYPEGTPEPLGMRLNI